MTKREKAIEFESATYRLERAKSVMIEAEDLLREAGLIKDADQLCKMITRLETFQNKYNR